MTFQFLTDLSCHFDEKLKENKTRHRRFQFLTDFSCHFDTIIEEEESPEEQYRSNKVSTGDQGRRKAPTPHPPFPRPLRYLTCTRCPSPLIIAREGWNPSVGVGGAWEVRWGQGYDSGSPPPP